MENGGTFWETSECFADDHNISALMGAGCSLDSLLGHPDVIQELRSRNSDTISFIETNIADLVDIVSQPHTGRNFRVATEVIASIPANILGALLRDEELFDSLVIRPFENADTETSESPEFSRLSAALKTIWTQDRSEMMKFLRKDGRWRRLRRALLRHLHSHAVTELLLECIAPPAETLEVDGMAEELLDAMEQVTDDDVEYSCATVSNIVSVVSGCMSTCCFDAREETLFDQLIADSTLRRLEKNLTARSGLLTVAAAQILHSIFLLRRFFNFTAYNLPRLQDDTDVWVSQVPNLKNALRELEQQPTTLPGEEAPSEPSSGPEDQELEFETVGPTSARRREAFRLWRTPPFLTKRWASRVVSLLQTIISPESSRKERRCAIDGCRAIFCLARAVLASNQCTATQYHDMIAMLHVAIEVLFKESRDPFLHLSVADFLLAGIFANHQELLRAVAESPDFLVGIVNTAERLAAVQEEQETERRRSLRSALGEQVVSIRKLALALAAVSHLESNYWLREMLARLPAWSSVVLPLIRREICKPGGASPKKSTKSKVSMSLGADEADRATSGSPWPTDSDSNLSMRKARALLGSPGILAVVIREDPIEELSIAGVLRRDAIGLQPMPQCDDPLSFSVCSDWSSDFQNVDSHWPPSPHAF